MDLLSRTVSDFDYTTSEPTKALDKKTATAHFEVAKATGMVQSFTQICSARNSVDVTLWIRRRTFATLCRLLQRELMKQNNNNSRRISVETRVATGL